MPLRFPTLFSAARAVAHIARPTFFGACRRCERTTPWYTNAVQGVYRCAVCGHDALDD